MAVDEVIKQKVWKSGLENLLTGELPRDNGELFVSANKSPLGLSQLLFPVSSFILHFPNHTNDFKL